MFSVFGKLLLFVALFLSIGQTLYEEGEFLRVSVDARKEIIRQASVWERPGGVRNVYHGPKTKIAVPPETLVTCRYVEPRGAITGYSPKFKCRLVESDEVVRIKLDSGEAHAEVAGTRLFWALGFYSDTVYPIKLRCLGCPEKNPSNPSSNEARVDRILEKTIMEQKFEEVEIAVYPDQGWSWNEMDLVDHKAEGSTKAEIDALKLLAVFIQHTDSKHEQQRLACSPKHIDRTGKTPGCKRPVMMIQDLGQTFGIGTEGITAASAMNFQGWSSQDIWNDELETELTVKEQGPRVCIGNLTSAKFAEDDGLSNPMISEEGRKFLANLLNELSEKQIKDLFQAARAGQTSEMILENGRMVPVTVEHWVAAFKKKRQQINDRECQE